VPRYDVECNHCGFEGEVRANNTTVLGLCPNCDYDELVWTPKTVQATVFKPFWHPHLASEPVYIESREQLRREMRTRGFQMKHSTVEGPREYDEKGRLRGVGI